MIYGRDGMRKLFVLFILMISFSIFADIIVEYTDNTPQEIIKTTQIEGKTYFNIAELNKVFQAKISSDIIDQRLTLQIYNQTIIFLIHSDYLTINNKIYQLSSEIKILNGNYYLPATILKNIFSVVLSDKIQTKGNNIIASPPFENIIKTIILDPGHGGKDPGAIGSSGKIYEKDITLKIALKVKKILEKKLSGINVILTRETDKFVSLKDRTTLANNRKADVFVSIHCNANRNHKARGTEVYYLSTAKTNEDRAVEALENSVVEKYEGGIQAVKRYDDLSFILADMSQNEHLQESYQLADILEQEITKETNFYMRGVKQANFYVMRGAFMPAVLIETGFLSNPEEEKLLNSEEYQNKIAKAIAESLIYFKKQFDKM